jgi:hypothetical protein
VLRIHTSRPPAWDIDGIARAARGTFLTNTEVSDVEELVRDRDDVFYILDDSRVCCAVWIHFVYLASRLYDGFPWKSSRRYIPLL